MILTLNEIAKKIDGKLIGPKNFKITGLSSLIDAKETELSFIINKFYLKQVNKSKAGAFLIEDGLPIIKDKPIIICKNSYIQFIKLLNIFYPQKEQKPTIHKSAVIADDVTLGKNVTIEPNVVINEGCYIGDNVVIKSGSIIDYNVHIGNNTIIHPKVTILHNVKIGTNVIIQSGAVIGSDGFGYTKIEGKHIKIPHVGSVVIGDNVEIGANCTIDRGTVGNTIIGDNTKIDNLVQIAHNVNIGKNCIIVAQSGISGSATLKDNVTLAGQSGVVGHLVIEKNSIIAARSVVTRCIPENSFVSGYPAKPHKEEIKIKASLKKLPWILKQIKLIEKKFNNKKSD